MKRIFTTLLCVLSTLYLTAETGRFHENDNEDLSARHIKGIVVDENGLPLPGASVVVVGTTIGAGTNTQGEFNLVTRDKEFPVLRASYIGYTPAEYKITPQDSSNRIVIRLQPTQSSLEEVVVTGTRTEKPLKDVPVLTRVIGQKEIQALNPMDIETLLQYELPGIQFSYNSMSKLPEITYQGMSGEYLLFLVDGERISGEGSDHNPDFSRFNIDDIERIEVVKGAQSTLYASNALGAVINIITKSANRPFSGNINARYGNNSGQKYTVSGGTKQSRFSSFTTISHRRKDTYTISDDSETERTIINPDGSTSKDVSSYSSTIRGYQIWDASQKFGYAFTDQLKGEIKGTYYRNKRDNATANAKTNDIFSNYTISARLNYLFNADHRLDFSYVFDNYRKDIDYFLAGYSKKNYENFVQTARLNYTGNFNDRHTFTAGVEANFEYLKHYMFKDSTNYNQQSYVIYLQEDWKVSDKINVIAGVRTDYHSKYHLRVTPKISAMYKPVELLTLRAGYAQGYRTPTLKELYEEYDMGGLGMFTIHGDENLKAENSYQFSLSGEVNKGIFYASLSGYYNKFKNKIILGTLEYIEDGKRMPDMKYMNSDNSESVSMEAIARIRTDCGLMLQGSYAYVHEKEEYQGYNLSLTRPHSVTFNASFQHKFGKVDTSVALYGQWSSKLHTNQYDATEHTITEYNYDARTICTLNTSARFPRGISVSLGIDNLFNYKDKSADAGIQIPEQGIGFIGTVSINLADLFKL
ncbi:TonB-dependent receptor [uncultured Bacteroides sp.]|jgi:Outer membrane receptor for ferrienterochelin and colicins|uniref:TonB-dependent receptor n=1 Tax=uncultured Bacteroides sp. TaxID=162156 RepID=UPI002676FD12|nr:TonB-dependent receptor [uncultured Bacteroides sp.]